MQELTAAQVAALPGANPKWPKLPALLIPYFDFAGKRTGFYRLRFLEDSRPAGFAQASDAKAWRYTQPADVVTEIYLPPMLHNELWAAIATDPERGIIITEGELKAAAAMAHGLLPCIGLGGATNYKSAERNMPLLPMLDAMTWQDREVTIVFDSDAVQNAMVEQAQYRFGNALLKKGAKVYIGLLPPAHDGAKQGLDDYLLANSALTFEEQVLGPAQPLAECEALHAFNDKFAFITSPGIVVNKATGQEMLPDKFIRHICGNATYTVPEIKVVDKKRKIVTLKEKRTAKEWNEWGGRSELGQMEYMPGCPPIKDHKFNTWRGWGCKPVKGDVTPWTTLLNHVVHEDGPAWRKWVEQWYAAPIQTPGLKMHGALVLYSPEKGTGKSMLGESMERIYGPENWGKIKEKDLTADFNPWQANKQFVMGEEISSGEARKTSIGEILKDMITQKRVTINRKYVPEYTVRDCVNYQFNTNHPDAFFLEDGDRRMAVNRTRAKPLPFEFYKDIYIPWIQSEEGAAALYWHLLHLDMKGFDPHAPVPDTQAKLDMKLAMRGGLYEWVHQLSDAPGSALGPYAFDLATADDLLFIYNTASGGNAKITQMRSELQRQNFRTVNGGVTIMTAKGTKQTLYVVRNSEKWLDCRPSQATAHLEGRSAPKRSVKVPKGEK